LSSGGLVQKSQGANSEFHKQIVDFSKRFAGSNEVVAICQSDDYTIEAPSQKSTVEVLIVVRHFAPRLMSYVRVIESRNVVFFVVDQWIFERDIERGFLGEALARLLIFPFSILSEGEYLHNQEVALKKRLILELLENIVQSYPEFSYRIRIKPEYFMYEIMLNGVRVFPPMAYGTSYILCGDASSEKVESVLKGFMEALTQLEKEGITILTNGYVMLSKTFVESRKNITIRISNSAKNAPRALFNSLFGVFPQFLNFLSQNSEALLKFRTAPWKKDPSYSKSFIDPRKFIFVPTGRGLVSLADKVDIRGFAKRVLEDGEYEKIKVEEFGGVLNDVYLMKACVKDVEKKILIKRFKDLSSLKWFPLSMWSMGVRNFALLGRSRLDRECAINEVLASSGFCVPKLLHVSANEGLVFMEFVEGENLSNAIKRIASAENWNNVEKDLVLVKEVGATYAKVHELNIILGDTKPENIIVDKKGKLCLIDFEQASRGGDKSWDVACFLYYSGHYLPLDGEAKGEAITKAFVAGYLKAGGSLEIIKCAGIQKYTRVFSVFTLPGTLRAMSRVCKHTRMPA
jgi:tRNA A-37 threonylcarbamoyl transferase component Bud32